MNIRGLILFFAMIVPCCLAAQENEKQLKFNFGAKAGFQAIAYNNPEFEIEGYEFDTNTLHSNKIGYTVAPFIRLTNKKLYVQAETVFGIARHSFDFKEVDENDNSSSIVANQTTYNLRTICLQVPIVVGYHIIQEGKYQMSLFTGPKTKFVFTAHSNQEFKAQVINQYLNGEKDCIKELDPEVLFTQPVRSRSAREFMYITAH